MHGTIEEEGSMNIEVKQTIKEMQAKLGQLREYL
jgi:hypothetical protein